jgi:hypothetical protein
MATLPKINVISADKVPAKAMGAGAKERLATYREKNAAERATTAAPLVTALLDGKSLSGTANTAEQAVRDAANVKRLVAAGLAAASKAASVRTVGTAWYIIAVAQKAAAAPAEAPVPTA